MTAQLVRIGASRLSVRVHLSDDVATGCFWGEADESGAQTLVEAAETLLLAPAEHLVFDLSRLDRASEWGVRALAGNIAEAHRLSKVVTLVRCPEWLCEALRRYGTGGPVRHAGSLAAATGGALGMADRTLAITMRSVPEVLPRVGRAILAFLQAHGVATAEVDRVCDAAEAACNHAVNHRSPDGPRNRVSISLHAEPDALILEVLDECDPPATRHPDAGWDDCIEAARQASDGLEVLPDALGTVWRFTWRGAS